ncbi:MAG TPA: hypothetical protein VM755_10845 [Stellaceae bacterium]|nr:hypothetical protein [Stellaceae bacterium]
MAGLSADTVQRYAREAQDIEISGERAATIAAAVEPLTGAARREAAKLAFESEPADFLRAQRRWLEAKR